jgi:hypothetical protein
MFERLQKPFLTVETGEAYQPIRLSYVVHDLDQLTAILDQLKCCKKNSSTHSWNWFWKAECDEQHFESLESFKKKPDHPLRLGTLTIRDGALYINLPSFKRACMAVPFFHQLIKSDIAIIDHADFINKVFGLDERLPHGFSELFKEDELERIVNERISDYQKVQHQIEEAATAEVALSLLSEYASTETKKRLPYAERYSFHLLTNPSDPDSVFLGFYIFLRSRELVAIRRWFGETGFTLSDAAEETMEKVFGGMNIDIIE